MMEMHELENAWSGLEARLESQSLELGRLREGRAVDSARARLRLLSAGQVVQLAVGVLIMFWAGGYWHDHLGQAHLVAYGVSLHLYGLAFVVTSAVQLAQLWRIDYRDAILDVQRQLLAIRRLRVRSERFLLIAGFLAWVPVSFIVFRWIGVDLWLTRPEAVWLNLAVATGLALLVAWLTHRYRAAFERDAAGRSLREAEADLEALSAH